jgi:hypothetical protein
LTAVNEPERAKRDLSFFSDAFGSEFDWLNDAKGLDMYSDNYLDGYGDVSTTQLLPTTEYTQLNNDDYSDFARSFNFGGTQEEDTDDSEESEDSSSNWDWLQSAQNSALTEVTAAPNYTTVDYDYFRDAEGESESESEEEESEPSNSGTPLNVREKMQAMKQELEDSLDGKPEKQKLFAMLNHVKKLNNRKEVLNERKEEQDTKLAERTNLKETKDAAIATREENQQNKATKKQEKEDWIAEKPARIQAKKDQFAADKAAKQQIIEAERTERIAERDSKAAIKAVKVQERLDTADEGAENEAAAIVRKQLNDSRKAINDARKNNQHNQGGELKRKFKVTCTPISESDQWINTGSITAADIDSTSASSNHCTNPVEGDICKIQFLENTSCGNGVQPFVSVQGSSEFSKFTGVKCVADGETGHWQALNIEREDKYNFEFSCGGCQFPDKENFHNQVVSLEEGGQSEGSEVSNRARITAGRGLDFNCWDKDGNRIFEDSNSPLVPINGYCKPHCINTHANVFDFTPEADEYDYRITCAAGNENKENFINNVLDKVNTIKSNWKGLAKLHAKLTNDSSPDWSNAKKFTKMINKWSELINDSPDEEQNGYICYKSDQPVYGEWSEWSDCSGAGWSHWLI